MVLLIEGRIRDLITASCCAGDYENSHIVLTLALRLASSRDSSFAIE
jgi:hypothetical protein